MKPSALRVARTLLAAPGRTLTTHELAQPNVGGLRFGARIAELREAGCEIETKVVKRSGCTYTLLSWPTEVDAELQGARVHPGGNDASPGQHLPDDSGPPEHSPASVGSLFPGHVGRGEPGHDREAV